MASMTPMDIQKIEPLNTLELTQRLMGLRHEVWAIRKELSLLMDILQPIVLKQLEENARTQYEAERNKKKLTESE